MYVIGTSGHIDHGKTSLIQSLTGTDCDRLPEEKARQMTIDIGFASMDVPGFGMVSVIDVPGHERFIRNMVAGAWGIDLGLLVVAADDGWMPQTEDHFRVLDLLGVERIIVAVSKIDLADEDKISSVERQTRERLSGSAFKNADIVRVSSRTGAGIEQLKKTIAANLPELSSARDAAKPYLYIDRVFAARGYGTVVTGTLRNGVFAENDPVHIQPGNSEARIKRIESHHSAQDHGSPSQRTALNLTGVNAGSLKRGAVLYRKNFFTESTEIIARIGLLDPDGGMKNNIGMEILMGTADVKGRVIHFSEITDYTSFPARIRFERPLHCYPGQPFVLTSPGGFRILGGGKVLFPGYDKKFKKQVAAGLPLFNAYSAEEMALFIVSVRQWMKKAELDDMLPLGSPSVESMLASLQARDALRIIGDYIAAPEAHESAVRAICAAVKDHLGLNLKEISDFSRLEIDICRLLVPGIQKANPIAEREGRFFWGKGGDSESLSNEMKKILDGALQKKADGLEIDKLRDDSIKRGVKELIKREYLVSLDGNILYHRQVYDNLKNKILQLFEGREKISISDAKAATGLSRKYLIPLLNRIERDGLVKRFGDFRIKV